MIFKTVILFFCCVIFNGNLLFAQMDTPKSSKKIGLGFNTSLATFALKNSEISGTLDFLPVINLNYGKSSLLAGIIIGKIKVDYKLANEYRSTSVKEFVLGYQYKLLEDKKYELYFQNNTVYSYIRFKNYLDKDWFPPFYGNHVYSNYGITSTVGYELRIKIIQHLYFNQGLGFGWGWGERKFDFDNDQFDDYKKYAGIGGIIKIGLGYNLL